MRRSNSKRERILIDPTTAIWEAREDLDRSDHSDLVTNRSGIEA